MEEKKSLRKKKNCIFALESILFHLFFLPISFLNIILYSTYLPCHFLIYRHAIGLKTRNARPKMTFSIELIGQNYFAEFLFWIVLTLGVKIRNLKDDFKTGGTWLHAAVAGWAMNTNNESLSLKTPAYKQKLWRWNNFASTPAFWD